MPVPSLPSENVPAPPSPNDTFDSGSRMPSLKNLSTSLTLSDIFFPRSSTIGFAPLLASMRAANIPHGPNPTTTGLSSPRYSSSTYSSGTGASVTFLFLIFSLQLKSTVYTSMTFSLSLASIDSFTIFKSDVSALSFLSRISVTVALESAGFFNPWYLYIFFPSHIRQQVRLSMRYSDCILRICRRSQ